MLCFSGFELYSRWVPLLSSWVIPEKMHTLPTKVMLENLTGEGGGWLTSLEVQMEGGL